MPLFVLKGKRYLYECSDAIVDDSFRMHEQHRSYAHHAFNWIKYSLILPIVQTENVKNVIKNIACPMSNILNTLNVSNEGTMFNKKSKVK